mgnify:CR=1 FL=1
MKKVRRIIHMASKLTSIPKNTLFKFGKLVKFCAVQRLPKEKISKEQWGYLWHTGTIPTLHHFLYSFLRYNDTRQPLFNNILESKEYNIVKFPPTTFKVRINI